MLLRQRRPKTPDAHLEILLSIYNQKGTVAQKLRPEREAIARRRLATVLETYAAASARTLEQKISDAGPDPLRIDPHILTPVRNAMVKERRLVRIEKLWYARANEDPTRLQAKIERLRPVQQRISNGSFAKRLGQTLEIAIFRSLVDSHLNFAGAFLDLEEHGDSTMYSKEEPPASYSGRRMPGKRLFDFILFDEIAGPIGVEAKNVREWIYPRQIEMRELSLKAAVSNTIPVLIGRRIPYVTRLVFEQCGFVFFEMFNQLYPYADEELAGLAADKDLLGFHDIRVGNVPSSQLSLFIQTAIIAEARSSSEAFGSHIDLIMGFGTGEHSYESFAARVRRRRQGRPEDSDEDEEEPEFDPEDY